jgi:hypothetical protein
MKFQLLNSQLSNHAESFLGFEVMLPSARSFIVDVSLSYI